MALVNGPLFSLGASGQVGKAIVYSKWKGRDYVREYVIPANPRTMPQIFQRSMLGALSRWWAGLASAAGAQSSWAALASAKNISMFNAMLSYNLDRETLAQWPVGDLDAGSTYTGSIVSVVGSSPETGRLVATANLGGDTVASDLVLFTLGTAGGANTTANTPRRIIGGVCPGASADLASIDVAGLDPGTYFVGAVIIGPDGDKTAIEYTASGVVVA